MTHSTDTPEESNDGFFCFQCGEPYIQNMDETTNHVDTEGEIDYDADRDHVPYG